MPDPSNRIHFGHSSLSMLHTSEIICDQYTEGFTVDSFIYTILVTVIIFYPEESKVNLETLIWLRVNMSVSMARWSFLNISLDAIGTWIKYFRSNVAELWYSINLFVSVEEVMITRISGSLVP